MKLLKIIEKIVYLAPSRCGRTFYRADVTEQDTTITVKVTPTDEFLLLDPRREDEASFPENFQIFEKWEHAGISFGSLEYFLQEANISYNVDSSTDEYFSMTIDNIKDEIEYDLSKHQQMKHSHRMYDIHSTVDQETTEILSSMITDFLDKNDGYNVMITDLSVRKKLYGLAQYWETNGEYLHSWQMNAPLIITVPPKNFDKVYYFNMGRLYASIGLTAIKRGYALAYCNSFNYLDPRVRQIQDILHLDYDNIDIKTVVPRSFICIGKPLDPSKPYNWIGEDNIFPSCILTSKSFLTMNTVTQSEKEVEAV
jgi:hypothetical protein